MLFSKTVLSDIFKKFWDKRVLVIGDVMLDKYVYGRLRGNSPEVQVPKFVTEAVHYKLGGAANVGNNLSKFVKYPVPLQGILGDDKNANIFSSLFPENLYNLTWRDVGKQTTVKTRLINLGVGDYLRIDTDIEKPLSEENIQKVVSRDHQIAPDVIVIADYFKGVFRHEVKELVNELKEKYNCKIILDPKGPNHPLYQGLQFDVMTPNLKEAFQLYNVHKVKTEDCLYGLWKQFRKPIVITKGKEGYHGFDGEEYFKGYALEENPVSVVGAGDVFNVGLTIGMTCDLSVKESAALGNLFASVAVMNPETLVISPEDILSSVAGSSEGCYTEQKTEV